mgnify:CR=1 FL=1
MELFDTHCHLDFESFDGDREEVLARAGDVGVSRLLVPGLDLASSRRAVQLAASYPQPFAAVGVHPNSVRSWRGESTQAELKVLADHPKVVAVGEIGLDYYRDHAPHDLQRQVLKHQLELALEMALPVVLHVRNAGHKDRTCIKDLLHILKCWQKRVTQQVPALRGRLGVVHSFSGNREEACRLIDMGFYLGITGPITYKNAHVLRGVVAAVDLARLIVETDAPFLSPHPYRGKRNEPAYVKLIAEKIGNVCDQSLEQIARITTKNAVCLFGLG